VVRDVSAMLQQIVERAAANPTEAAELGITPKDVDAMNAARAAIAHADRVQEQKRARAPLSTQERNRTANRIVAAVGRIAGAGVLEFARDPATRGAFEALRMPSRKKKAKKVAKADDGAAVKAENGAAAKAENGAP
jgi:hypothetical protein